MTIDTHLSTMIKLAILYLVILLASCQEVKQREKSNQKPLNSVKTKIKDSKPNNQKYNHQLTLENAYFDSSNAYFSNLSEKDKFTFQIPKGDINKTISILRINSKKEGLIYEKQFETYLLINGYDLEYIHTKKEMLNYVLNKARKLLSKNSFISIAEDQLNGGWISTSTKEGFYDYETFERCKIEKRPLFSISLGEEDTEVIGYSTKEGKVKDIIGCC